MHYNIRTAYTPSQAYAFLHCIRLECCTPLSVSVKALQIPNPERRRAIVFVREQNVWLTQVHCPPPHPSAALQASCGWREDHAIGSLRRLLFGAQVLTGCPTQGILPPRTSILTHGYYTSTYILPRPGHIKFSYHFQTRFSRKKRTILKLEWDKLGFAFPPTCCHGVGGLSPIKTEQQIWPCVLEDEGMEGGREGRGGRRKWVLVCQTQLEVLVGVVPPVWPAACVPRSSPTTCVGESLDTPRPQSDFMVMCWWSHGLD